MLVAERHSRLLTRVRTSSPASTEELAQLLEVSAETVRRDLLVLERRGALTRVRGGAAVAGAHDRGDEAAFTRRSGWARQAKARIGRAAATLVRPGQTVVLDLGTTAEAVARALPRDLNATVATCSLRVATELADHPGLEVLICGGRVRAGDLAVSNAVAQAFFADFYADIAFLGSGGIDVQAGLTDYHLDEVAVRRTILGNTAQSFVLADASKLGRVARHRVCALDRLSGVITDAPPPDELADAGVEFVVAGAVG